MGGTGNDLVYGDSGNDIIDGGNNNNFLSGGSGNDTLFGGSGHDYLNGTNYSAKGTGERDSLESTNIDDSDTFVLAEGTRVFYNGRGNEDYAVIRGFDFYDFVGDIADKIPLSGNRLTYSLANVTLDGVSGAGISFAGDLIGIVRGVDASSLNLADTNQFIFTS